MFDYRVGELTVAGHVVIPKTFPGKKLPILIFNRGGNSTIGPLTFSSVMNGHMTWAEHGYIVISSQYRGAKLGGVRGEGQDEFGGRDVDDVMALLPIIDGIPEADATRIGMVGMSRGSIMTYRAVARSRRIKAIAISGGVSDLITELPRRPGMERMLESYIPGFATHRDQVLKERSVIYWLDKMDPELPVLLLHGDADKNVAVENATMLAEKLREKGQPYKLVVYPGGDHGLLKYRRQANDEILAWFKLHLSGKN
jgi:dipeptidyl aminopeptidase/acylaminoacyl peptidase